MVVLIQKYILKLSIFKGLIRTVSFEEEIYIFEKGFITLTTWAGTFCSLLPTYRMRYPFLIFPLEPSHAR